jgi:low temperature requirement protein LtrA
MGGPSGEHPPASTPDRQRVRPTRAVRRPPRLRTLENTNEERHASALELFFDLVFVVAIAELGETLSRHPTATGFLHFAVVFVPVWWAWVGYTVYADRFDTDDLIFLLAMLTAMLVVVWMAIEIPSAFHNASGGGRFAGAYAAVRFGLVALYLRADHTPGIDGTLKLRSGSQRFLCWLHWLASGRTSPQTH